MSGFDFWLLYVNINKIAKHISFLFLFQQGSRADFIVILPELKIHINLH